MTAEAELQPQITDSAPWLVNSSPYNPKQFSQYPRAESAMNTAFAMETQNAAVELQQPPPTPATHDIGTESEQGACPDALPVITARCMDKFLREETLHFRNAINNKTPHMMDLSILYKNRSADSRSGIPMTPQQINACAGMIEQMQNKGMTEPIVHRYLNTNIALPDHPNTTAPDTQRTDLPEDATEFEKFVHGLPEAMQYVRSRGDVCWAELMVDGKLAYNFHSKFQISPNEEVEIMERAKLFAREGKQVTLIIQDNKNIVPENPINGPMRFDANTKRWRK